MSVLLWRKACECRLEDQNSPAAIVCDISSLPLLRSYIVDLLHGRLKLIIFMDLLRHRRRPVSHFWRHSAVSVMYYCIA